MFFIVFIIVDCCCCPFFPSLALGIRLYCSFLVFYCCQVCVSCWTPDLERMLSREASYGRLTGLTCAELADHGTAHCTHILALSFLLLCVSFSSSLSSSLFIKLCFSFDFHAHFSSPSTPPSSPLVLLSSIFSSSCVEQKRCVKAWECVWIAGEKGAGWCACVWLCGYVWVSITLHQIAHHEAHSAVFRQSLGVGCWQCWARYDSNYYLMKLLNLVLYIE